VTKAQIVTAKSQPKETATLFSIGADETKAVGHSSYLGACQSLIAATCCDSKINVLWRDSQANSWVGKFAWAKLFANAVLFLPLLQLFQLLSLWRCTEHIHYHEPWTATMVPLDKAVTFRSETKICALFFLLCFL